ncbi:EscU/YscU/HrcU family type III secretion system export apparatus switch protein [Buchnera aphidicola]|uniref:EscU/YscU/HrcU family type III secretion system export apparatus switch protein n=1 Tax=Buchnera aphidicola TaxID=9 RepID=UPI0031B8843B
MNNENKTEKPTLYKLKQNFKYGNKIYFKELNTFLIFFMVIFYFFLNKNIILDDFLNLFKYSLKFGFFYFDNDFYFFLNIFKEKILFHFIYLFLIITVVNLFFPFLFGNKLIQFNRININFKKINLINNFKNIISYKNLYDSFLSIIKLFLIILIYIFYIFIFYKSFFVLFSDDLNIFLINFIIIIYIFFFVLLISFIPIVLLDILNIKSNYYYNLFMTKKEIEDEKKFLEGGFLNKKIILKKMNLINENNNIIYSDIILLNIKKKFLIALQYKKKKIRLIVKNFCFSFSKIKKLGSNYNIPIISSFLLVEMIYKYVNVGSNIPKIFSKNIIEIFYWLNKLKNWEKYGGKYPIKPDFFSVLYTINYRKKNN